MALVRALLQADVGDLTVIAGFGGLDVDLTVGYGVVRRLIAAFVGAENAAPLPPAVRWAVETGRVEAWDIDAGILLAALRAAAGGVPFAVWTAGIGTAVADSPLVELAHDTTTGRPLLRVRPLAVDVALLWAQAADTAGNVLRWGPDLGDDALASAADRRIVQVERLVTTSEVERHPERVSDWQADAVVVAPLGTYPFASTALNDDLAWMRAYAERVAQLRADPDREWADLRGAIHELLRLDGDDDAFLVGVGVPQLRRMLE